MIIVFLSTVLIFSFAQNSEQLGQLSGKLVYNLEPGESETLQWGIKNTKDQPITVTLFTIGDEGSELLSFPEFVDLPPNKVVYVDVTVTIPQDHPADVYYSPRIHATEYADQTGTVRINVIVQTKPEIIIGNPVIREVIEEPKPEKVTTPEPKQEVTLEAEEPKEPGSFTIAQPEEGGGCLISTATFGSELAPQVQMLREIRDNKLLSTESGSTFMTGFNTIYYSFSPTIADWERQSPIFREVVQIAITPLITSLSILNYINMDSEAEVLGYGISLIILNVGMYFVAPAILITKLRR